MEDRQSRHSASLEKAHLSGAHLNGANLGGANLRFANLNGANLNGANLFRADFKNSTVGNTAVANIDLSTVKALETVQHFGPSTIGIGTIYRSQGKIPEVFLRGTGVPEPFIVQMKAVHGEL